MNARGQGSAPGFILPKWIRPGEKVGNCEARHSFRVTPGEIGSITNLTVGWLLYPGVRRQQKSWVAYQPVAGQGPCPMNTSLLFWILMLLYLVAGLWANWPVSGANAKAGAGTVLVFVLLAVLGWKVFGPAVHGP